MSEPLPNERQLKSADDIRKEVIDSLVSTLGAMQRVPSIGRVQALREPDRNGCNWYIDTYGDIRGMVAEVGSVVAAAKGRYNLFAAAALPPS